ncbi:MAG: hypothetical protein IJX53_04655 [Clostridia bacterium]|nr:hypothetical protein [Clostridia bacterium]
MSVGVAQAPPIRVGLFAGKLFHSKIKIFPHPVENHVEMGISQPYARSAPVEKSVYGGFGRKKRVLFKKLLRNSSKKTCLGARGLI